MPTLAQAPPDHAPLPMVDATRSGARREFDKWALSYDRSWLREIVFFPSARACQEEILRWKARRAATGRTYYRLLDVGCGTGNLLAIMSRDRDAERLVGLDYSPVMVEKAAAKIRETAAAAAHAFVVHADSERLPFADASFDVVTCANSFHHYPKQSMVVKEFRRVLRSGGLTVLIDGFRDNVVGWVVFDLGVASLETDVHHAPWTQVREYFNAAGFKAIQQRKMNVLAPLLVTTATPA